MGGYRRLASLQTLLYPADLEKLVRKVSTEARTVVEETGTNMLYLMFGFLEYYDSDDSDKPVLAPLLSMPVSLARGNLDNDSRTYLYDVTYSGQDIAENFTLREKFKQQFTLQFPELGEEDILDINTPNLEACATARQLRETVGRRPKVVARTAIVDSEAKQRIDDAGFDVCLSKPADFTQLLSLLSDFDARRTAAR